MLRRKRYLFEGIETRNGREWRVADRRRGGGKLSFLLSISSGGEYVAFLTMEADPYKNPSPQGRGEKEKSSHRKEENHLRSNLFSVAKGIEMHKGKRSPTSRCGKGRGGGRIHLSVCL